MAAVVVAELGVSTVASAQEVVGRVLDPSISRPIAGASVVVAGTEIMTMTDAAGWFRIDPGPADRIIVSLLGYAADTVSIDRTIDALTVHLQPLPITIQGISALASPERGTYAMTREMVRQVPALAEPDLLRAVALLPLASQPNDLKGRIHLAGGSSDETGLTLDGHPLLDPFHLLGLLSAFPLSTLERADIHVQHMAPELGGRLSGTIAMVTAPPDETPAHEVTVGLAATTATYARLLPLGLDVLASGRITYIDRLADMVDIGEQFPRYGFRDGLLRVGSTRGNWRTELLMFGTRDRFRETRLEELGEYDPLTWGESLLGARVTRDDSRTWLELRASRNHGTTNLDERNVGSSNQIDIRREVLSADVAAGIRSERVSVRAGLGVRHNRVEHEWAASGLVDEVLSRNVPGRYSGSDTLNVGSAWGEVAWRPVDMVRIAVGARVSNAAGAWYAAPRFDASAELQSGLVLRLSANRRFQFDGNVEEPVEGSASPPVFLFAHPRRADIIGLSAEKPVHAGDDVAIRLRADLHLKRYTDRILLDTPEPGVDSIAFPSVRRTNGDAIAIATSMRMLFGESGMLDVSYVFQRVRESILGTMYPTSWDVPHALTAWGSWRFGSGWAINATVQARSGRATTPIEMRLFAPRLEDGPGPSMPSRYIEGDHNSIRVPPYQRVDLGVRRTWHSRAQWTLAIQVLNVFGRTNAIDYDWLQHYRSVHSGFGGGLRSGLPILPTVGLEVRW